MSTATLEHSPAQTETLEHADRQPCERLREHVADWHSGGVTVDPETGMIHNVALAGLVSRNGYRYTEEALRDAAPLYEGKPVFLDHARDAAKPQERSTRDLAGTVVRPRFHDGRLRADISTVSTEAGRTLFALAEKDQPGVGMSHVVLAQRSPDGGVVERIHDVVSVDAVAFPATTTTFREHRLQEGSAGDNGASGGPSNGTTGGTATTPSPSREHTTLAPSPLSGGATATPSPLRGEGWGGGDESPLPPLPSPSAEGAEPADGRPSASPALSLQRHVESLTEALRALAQRVSTLEQRGKQPSSEAQADSDTEEHTSADRLRRVQDLLIRRGVAEELVTPCFLETLQSCADQAAMRRHVDDRLRLARRLRAQSPTSLERDADFDSPGIDRRAETALIEAVTEDWPGVLTGVSQGSHG